MKINSNITRLENCSGAIYHTKKYYKISKFSNLSIFQSFNQSGFTQAELIITLAIFVILLGVAVGRFSKSTLIGLDVESYANKIASDLRLAARLSQVNSQRYDVEFYGKGGATDTNYTYYKIKNYDTGEYYLYNNENVDGSIYLSNDIACTPLGNGVSAVQTISFYTEGYVRMLTSAGADITDTTKNGISCNGADGKQSMSFATIYVTLETSLVKVEIKRAGESQ